MANILKTLNQTPTQYFAMRWMAYWDWCESVSTNNAQIQMVIANTAVNNWYNMEYAKCETLFVSMVKDYPNIQPLDAMKIYTDCTFKMFNIRCEPLIKHAKQNNIGNGHISIKAQTKP